VTYPLLIKLPVTVRFTVTTFAVFFLWHGDASSNIGMMTTRRSIELLVQALQHFVGAEICLLLTAGPQVLVKAVK
jgi:hypothetical protein